MSITFVTRHPGALEWARAENLLPPEAIVSSSLDAESVQPGDLVIGTLPAQIAARICERGGRYQHLTLDLPERLRGLELGADDMRHCGARLEEFHIQRTGVAAQSGTKEPSNVHVVLASGETLPNLIPALARPLRADRVVILSSNAMRANARRLQHGLVAAGIDEKSVLIRPGCPDHDLAEILQWAQQRAGEIAGEFPDSRRILNLTGGNKLMTVAFLQAFRPSAEIIYCDTEKSRVDYFHPLAKPGEKLPVNLLRLSPYLAVQGYRIRQTTPDQPGIRNRESLTRKLVESAPRTANLIGSLNAAARDYGNEGVGKVRSSTGALERELLDSMVDRGLLRRTGGDVAIVDPAASTYLAGGWLEEWCWLVGKELEQGESGKRLHADRWGINLQIDPWDHAPIPGRDRHPLNELDAVFVHRNRMLLIECKSGIEISDPGESQDILNKLETLGKHVGGRLDSKWLLTARRINRNPQAEKRAEKYGITLIRPHELIQLKDRIAHWMTS